MQQLALVISWHDLQISPAFLTCHFLHKITHSRNYRDKVILDEIRPFVEMNARVYRPFFNLRLIVRFAEFVCALRDSSDETGFARDLGFGPFAAALLAL